MYYIVSINLKGISFTNTIELIPEMSTFLNNSFGGNSTETLCVYQDGIVCIGVVTAYI